MSDSTSENVGVSAPVESDPVFYRCVCGESLSLDPTSGGTCPVCDRKYSPEAVLAATAETVSIELIGDTYEVAIDTAAEEKADDRIGSVLDHFRIVSCLGHGGMGSVYRALDESLQRFVALKVIRTDGEGDDEEHVQSLVREARAQARVGHPNVVTIYFVGREENSAFFAMELINGPTLEDRLKTGPLPYAEVVQIALEIVKALDYAASFDIVHGDIKPSNILLKPGSVPLNEARTVKLSDFGLAQRVSDSRSGNARIVGTPNYLSPEAASGQPRDVRSDMYSLGVTLFEMTFGRLPYTFGESSVQDRLKMHREAEIEFPESWPTSVPDGWRTILQRLLAKSPTERYENYRALTKDLKRLQPVPRPQAGRAPRAFAWCLDLLLAHTTVQVLMLPFITEDSIMQPRERFFAAAMMSIVALLASLLQAHRGTTPGKRVFQMRLVDQHGLRPGKGILAMRMAVQMLPIWGLAAANLLRAIVAPEMGSFVVYGVGLLVVGVLAVDSAFCLFHPHAKTLHDLIFGTHVDLDTK